MLIRQIKKDIYNTKFMEAVIYNISKFTVVSLIEHLHNTIA